MEIRVIRNTHAAALDNAIDYQLLKLRMIAALLDAQKMNDVNKRGQLVLNCEEEQKKRESNETRKRNKILTQV